MTPTGVNETVLNRRAFLGLSLSWLAFWRRGLRKLAGIEFRVLHGARSGRRFLHIHGNEATARDVLTDFMKRSRGTAYIVRHTQRNVEFKGGQLDPNRLFSGAGAERNLRTLNPTWSEAQVISAGIVLARHRHELVDAVRPTGGDILIVMHNNGPGYSVNDEVPISDRSALNDAANPHEFCLCTGGADFERLAKGPYNVVLQNRPGGEEDGSLSRLAAREGWRYINIEAGLGKREKQTAMLAWVASTLPPN